ncbi:MAG: histidine kinase dimerization/phospho-acceptor domain-containing protein [Sphingomonadaceae bacterium]
MHFDDRLGTVLRMRADGPGMQRVQYRQLLDLLGTLPVDAGGEQLEAAYDRLGELGAVIPAEDRAALLREPALRLRAPRLVAALASGEGQVAATALQRARLSDEQWRDLVPALPPATRPALRQRRDLSPTVAALLARLGINDRGLPPAAAAITEAGTEIPLTAPLREGDGIGAIVRRIEAYRRAKEVIDLVPANDSPRLPLGEEHVLAVPAQVRACDLATDAELRVTWCDAGIAPMLMGARLAGDEELARLARRHQPLRAQAITLGGAPAIAGDWQLDAAPWFDPLTGRFLGYRGRLRRPARSGSAQLNPPVTDSQADRIRQMLHELRNPVNAIQGFAELIQQQLFGPTPHEYRALAAGIAGDAARMLAAFEELERLAKLDSRAMALEDGETDLAAVIEATAAQLGAHTKSRGSGFGLKLEAPSLAVPLATIEVERIVWRLLATLAGVSAPGEQLKLRARARDGMVRIDVALPAQLATRSEDEIFHAAAGSLPQVVAAGVFGVGFALRLARAEARAAGGDLVRKNDRLRLTLPGLTADRPSHTQGAEQGAAGHR